MDIDALVIKVRRLEEKFETINPEPLLRRLDEVAPMLEASESFLERLEHAETTVANLTEQLLAALEGLGHTQEHTRKLTARITELETVATAPKDALPEADVEADEDQGG